MVFVEPERLQVNNELSSESTVRTLHWLSSSVTLVALFAESTVLTLHCAFYPCCQARKPPSIQRMSVNCEQHPNAGVSCF